MKLKIVNKSTQNMGELEQILTKFFPYAQKRLGFDKPVQLNLVSDLENAKDPFGKTAYYNPGNMHITLFIDKRHPKDILRSFSHELVHHSQNCNGEFENEIEMEKGYAQENKHLRKLEAMAYLLGNGLIVRDYCDTQLKESKIMSSKNIENVRELIQQAINILQEGGAAARSGNEDRDVGRERMASDRIREEDEKALEEDEETLEEEEVNEDDEALTEDEKALEEKEVNESFTSKKDQMLFEDLIEKWCK